MIAGKLLAHPTIRGRVARWAPRRPGLDRRWAAVLASSCCVPILAPLIVAVLGASGAAWAAGLKPYSPYLLAGSLALLLYGLWTVYRPRPACPVEGRPTKSGRGVKAVLWVAVGFWTLAALLNLWLPRS